MKVQYGKHLKCNPKFQDKLAVQSENTRTQCGNLEKKVWAIEPDGKARQNKVGKDQRTSRKHFTRLYSRQRNFRKFASIPLLEPPFLVCQTGMPTAPRSWRGRWHESIHAKLPGSWLSGSSAALLWLPMAAHISTSRSLGMHVVK
jgi:hypothetical protein